MGNCMGISSIIITYNRDITIHHYVPNFICYYYEHEYLLSNHPSLVIGK